MSKTSVIFFGSGPVAAESLRLLVQDFTIEAVITKPSTKNEMQAAAPDSRLFTVSTKTELESLLALEQFTSILGILIDFGIIVSQKAIDFFPKGIVNSHFSLLPEWRGADPITFSILSGQKQTGVSLMLLVEAMDEGPLLAQSIYEMADDITNSQLTGDLIELSHRLLCEMLPAWLDDRIEPIPQDQATLAASSGPSYSRKLAKQDGIINWSKPAVQIEREIRAFQIWPKSKTKLSSVDVVITASKVSKKQIEKPGQVIIEYKNIYVGCGEQSLEITSLKPPGKKEMPASAFLAGYRSKLQ